MNFVLFSRRSEFGGLTINVYMRLHTGKITASNQPCYLLTSSHNFAPHSHVNKTHSTKWQITGLGKSEDKMDWNFLKIGIISEIKQSSPKIHLNRRAYYFPNHAYPLRKYELMPDVFPG
jgi:hypothetical protein